MPSTNPNHLERWLSAEKVAHLSQSMRGWYGPPIAVNGVPGEVFATGDGDFIGKCRAGWEMSALDRAEDMLRRLKRAARIASSPKRLILNTGFASLSDLISEATVNSKRRDIFQFQKAGSTGVVNGTSSLWRVGAQPSAGATPSAAPAGNAPDDTTAGAFPFTNPSNPDTQHFLAGYPIASLANTLLLYDRIFHVAKTMASVATEAVTGVPTRYQSTTSSDPDYVGGNFLFVEVGGTQLANTGHNWTVCQYQNQTGSGTATLPSLTGNAAAIVDRLDHPLGQWFAPLAAGDIGVKKLTQMQCSASVATGLINFVIGHPIAWMPCQIAGVMCVADGLNTSFNLTRIFDDAALALLEVIKPATTATTYTGSFLTVAG